ncbi:16S rRNA (guanine(966)-N(2))-methyltransferase RsmD [Kaarinaea lacus]
MNKKSPGLSNTVRIIGGKWRGKKLSFPSITGLRPTPDRIRETVFNWLQFELQGARVLDLFAGSGAFGLEALSRGAAYAVFVEKDSKAVMQLNMHIRELHIDNARVEHCDSKQYLLGRTEQPFDIVFLDPPYGQQLLQPCLTDLEFRHFLADKAYIYLEAERSLEIETLPLPQNWHLHRSKHSGQVSYHLAQRNSQRG